MSVNDGFIILPMRMIGLPIAWQRGNWAVVYMQLQ